MSVPEIPAVKPAKPRKIKVPDALPSTELWPFAVVMRPTSACAEWHLYAVAKGKNDGFPIMAQYTNTMQLGVWALVERKTGVVVEAWPVGAWVAEALEPPKKEQA